VGRVQLRRLDEFVARRRSLKAKLDAVMGRFPEIEIQVAPPNVSSANHLYTCFLTEGCGIDNRDFSKRLDRLGIEMHLRYFPLHLLPEWRLRGGEYGQCPIAERLWFGRQINLPIYPSMDDASIDHIDAAVEAALGQN